MSKNAFVVRGYLDGAEQTHDRQVIEEMTNDTFAGLEKNGLVREATAAEVKAAKDNDGFVPAKKAADAPSNKAAQTASNKSAS
jgi:hypothetical protein